MDCFPHSGDGRGSNILCVKTGKTVVPAKLSPFLAEESVSFINITDPPSRCIAAPNEDDVLVLTS